jgi:hypothetical protein
MSSWCDGGRCVHMASRLSMAVSTGSELRLQRSSVTGRNKCWVTTARSSLERISLSIEKQSNSNHSECLSPHPSRSKHTHATRHSRQESASGGANVVHYTRCVRSHHCRALHLRACIAACAWQVGATGLPTRRYKTHHSAPPANIHGLQCVLGYILLSTRAANDNVFISPGALPA